MDASKLTPEEKLTLQSYDKYGADWANAHKDFTFWAKELFRFNKYLPSGKILEIGAGGGRDAKMLIQSGYDYLGTDISKGLLRAAQKNLPNTKFLQKSVYNLDFPKNSFDGFWACAVLLHIPKSRINEALTQIHNAIMPGGVGFISVKKGEGEEVTVEPPPDGKRFFAYYSLEEFKNVLTKNGFKILYTKERKKTKKTTWLIYIVTK